MAEVKDLREKMANIATEARSKLSEVTDKTPEDRAAEIEREFDAMMAEHDKLAAKVERLERAEAAVRAAESVDYSRRPVGDVGSAPAVDPGFQMDYRAAFAEMIAAGGDAYLDPEVRNVLREYRVQTKGTDSQGGYTVPTELATFIEKAMIATGPMYGDQFFTVINSADGRTFNIPTIDDTAKVAVAHTEGTQPTDDGGSDAVFGQKSLSAYAFDSEWIRWSAELNADSILNMESLLGELIGERLGRIANSKLTTGSGSSDVEGIVTNSAAGKVAAATNAVTADEIIDLIHSVDPAYRTSPNTAIMMADATLSAVRKLKDGDGNYLWQMGNYQAGVPQSLLGYNVVVNQAMANVGSGVSSKVMLFGDMSTSASTAC
jgi:HK97 family phage major capsid protein